MMLGRETVDQLTATGASVRLRRGGVFEEDRMQRMRECGYLAVVLVAALAMPACGTLMGGTMQPISVQSNPAGAQIETQPASTTAQTPATLSLERKTAYTLTVTRTGYAKKQIALERQMRTGVLIADIILFPIGVIVDAVTGAWYKLSPSPITIQLEKLMSEAEGPAQITVTIQASEDGKKVRLESSDPVTVTLAEKKS
jgi:hypothetical protein